MKRNWQDPEFRARNAEAVKRNWQDPEFRARNAEATKRNWQDPEFRARNAEAVKRAVQVTWDADMDAALRQGLARGWNMTAIAEEIGVCVPTAAARADELGLERPKKRRAA